MKKFLFIGLFFMSLVLTGCSTEMKMPNLEGMNLEDVQDNYSFELEEKDLKYDRAILWSSNWKICSQSVKAGKTVDSNQTISVDVVKTNEICAEYVPVHTPIKVDNSWREGFDYGWGTGVAWEWVNSGGNCYGDYCWRVKLVTEHGCPNGIYAEINIESDGVVVGWTNDTLNYLAPKQEAILTFNYFGSGGSLSGDLVELSCS